jgi:hypothetical protein
MYILTDRLRIRQVKSVFDLYDYPISLHPHMEGYLLRPHYQLQLYGKAMKNYVLGIASSPAYCFEIFCRMIDNYSYFSYVMKIFLKRNKERYIADYIAKYPNTSRKVLIFDDCYPEIVLPYIKNVRQATIIYYLYLDVILRSKEHNGLTEPYSSKRYSELAWNYAYDIYRENRHLFDRCPIDDNFLSNISMLYRLMKNIHKKMYEKYPKVYIHIVGVIQTRILMEHDRQTELLII